MNGQKNRKAKKGNRNIEQKTLKKKERTERKNKKERKKKTD